MGARNLQMSRIGIVDLLDTRLEYLTLLRTADEHIATLTALRAELEAARDAEERGARVGRLVARHVDFTAALAAALEMYRRDPLAQPAEREAAERLFEATVAERMGPQHSTRQRVAYVEAAARNRAALGEDLARFPAPPGGRSVADLLDAWIAVGFEIGAAVSAQTKVVEEARAPSPLVRATEYALARLRRAIRVEQELYDDLPTNLEALILGYIDKLGQPRRRGAPSEVVEVEEVAEAPAEPPVEAVTPALSSADAPAEAPVGNVDLA